METIKLIELTDRYAIYEFYPEDKDENKGIVKYDRITKERIFLEKPNMILALNYASHAWRRIEEYDKCSDFKEYDMIAWM